jgi:ferric-dicitrate binding protein FerR (iron transport regulator)
LALRRTELSKELKVRTKGLLQGLALLLLIGVGSGVGYAVGRWQGGDFDLLCASDFRPYRSRIALHDGNGIQLPAGSQVQVRFCEYNAQARLEVLIEKSEFDQLEPDANPRGERWLYNLQP